MDFTLFSDNPSVSGAAPPAQNHAKPVHQRQLAAAGSRSWGTPVA